MLALLLMVEIVSGGHFKATRHRVFEPPADQRHLERLSLVLFESSIGNLRMEPAMGKSHSSQNSSRDFD